MPPASKLFCASAAGARSWADFSSDVAAARDRIAGAARICNLLDDRYQFAVGLAAALLNGQVTVLPSSRAPKALETALGSDGDGLVLGSTAGQVRRTRRIERLPDGSGRAAPDDVATLIADLKAAPGEVHVYTSGSTGLPVRHCKRWRTLAGGAVVTEAILSAAGLEETAFAILGTTPHQHMYGLEASIFSGLAFHRTLYRDTIFYPADLESAVATTRDLGASSSVLVSSPAHLRYLEPTIASLSELSAVISATAPLPLALAERLEAADIPVFEIYGSTETGSLAWRRTAADPRWMPAAGFELADRPEGCEARAPHLEAPILLGDAVLQEPDGRFHLLGRIGDLVNVAGKRTSLGTLNAVLLETPGLADGLVLRHKRDEGDWLGVLVVPSQPWPSAEDVRAAVRRQFRMHLDPVFLPQRIQLVESLPRSGTGKIPASDQDGLLAELLGRDPR